MGNGNMHRNVRAYFDRPREAESYGTKHRPTLRAIWQLETPVMKPVQDEESIKKALANWQVGGACSGGAAPKHLATVTKMADLTTGGIEAKKKELIAAMRTGGEKVLSETASAPNLFREIHWDKRHQTMFGKDNHLYHPNFREYFERPRGLLY